VSSPSVRAEPRPKTNLVHFVAARRTLIAIIRIIVSAVMEVETHTVKHEQQKCDHVYIHTPYTRAFFHTINLQSEGCGQARGVSPRRNAAEERWPSVPTRASPEVPVRSSAFQKVPVWRSGAFRLSLSTVNGNNN